MFYADALDRAIAMKSGTINPDAVWNLVGDLALSQRGSYYMTIDGAERGPKPTEAPYEIDVLLWKAPRIPLSQIAAPLCAQ